MLLGMHTQLPDWGQGARKKLGTRYVQEKKKNIFGTHTTSKQWQTGGQCHVTDLPKALTEQYFNFTMLKAVPHLIMCGFGDSIP